MFHSEWSCSGFPQGTDEAPDTHRGRWLAQGHSESGDQRQELWSLSGSFYPPKTQLSRDWVLALRSPRHLRCPGPCPSLGGTKRSLAGRWKPQTQQASACLQPGSRGFIRCALWHMSPGYMHNRIFKKCFESLIYLFVIVFHNSFHSKARTCF